MGVFMNTEEKNIFFKIAIFVALGGIVTTIIYLTPVPGQYPQSCSRPCHELDWPMICRVKITLERFQTLGSFCRDCPRNQTHCYHNKCISADGQPRGILTANRQFPGPTIEVCQNDIVLVDVINRIPGQSFGVHWRGQKQVETPYMDGVPMVTQCPIPSLTTFQYKFRATESGTHMWQVNTGEELLDTLFGPLIVKKPESKEIHKTYYDTDESANIVVIHSWDPQKENFLFENEESKTKLLINGKTEGNDAPASVFKISPCKRHRFRVLYMGGVKNCQIRFSIENHQFLVIALDGHSIEPKKVTSARLFPGERFDFVLEADQTLPSHRMVVEPVDCQNLMETHAFIQYDGILNYSFEDSTKEVPDQPLEIRTNYDEDCIGGEQDESPSICLEALRTAEPIEEEILPEQPDFKFYFFYNSTVVFSMNVFNTSIVGVRDTVRVPRTNNLTMMLPSSPLISQSSQIAPDLFCNSDIILERCKNNVENICECVHLVDVPLNAVVELVLINQDDKDHVFHLHGYVFHVIGMSNIPVNNITPDDIKRLDSKNELLKRNLDSPVLKDTVALISNSLAVLRFKADNPGYWLLDEEHSSHWSKGMSVVLRIGKDSDLPPVPENFPKCGNWIGPEYFLT